MVAEQQGKDRYLKMLQNMAQGRVPLRAAQSRQPEWRAGGSLHAPTMQDKRRRGLGMPSETPEWDAVQSEWAEFFRRMDRGLPLEKGTAQAAGSDDEASDEERYRCAREDHGRHKQGAGWCRGQ